MAVADLGAEFLALILKFLDRPADAGDIRHRFAEAGAAMSERDLLVAAKPFDVKARAISTKLGNLPGLPLPALALTRDNRWIVLAQAMRERLLVQDPALGRPQILGRDDFAALWSGRLILMATRETIAGARRKFDITWFIPAIVRFRGLFLTVLIASFGVQILALASPLFMQVVIDKVLVHRAWSTLDVLVAGLLVVTLSETLLSALRTWLFTHTATRVDAELAGKLFDHLIHLPLPYFQVRRTGQSVARVRELENIRQFLTSNALTLVIDLFFTLVFFAIMFLYSAQLALIVLASVPAFAAIVVAIAPVLRRRVEEKFERGAENQAFLVEAVSGIETIKSLATEPQMIRRWDSQTAAYLRKAFDVAALANIGSHAIQLVAKLTTAAVLWWGAHLVIEGGLTVGQFVAFNMFANHAIGPILRLAQMWQDFQQVRISLARMGDILDTPAEPGWTPGRASLPPIRGEIEFQRVTYAYRPDTAAVLQDISFTLKAGEVVGIVGASGSGKSTIAKLVQRLYVPTQGRILVDGVDLALADPTWLRRQIGVVPQEKLLFSRSIRDNIALVDRTVPMERIAASAKLAGAHEFILQMPHGYDTEVEERGMNLSGGQRQRIALARALLNEPRILILDEATSALDAESEEIIQHNMTDIVKDRTVIVIAHRLSALRMCGRIIGLQRCAIVEDGTPEELVRQAGPFARFARKQIEALKPPTRWSPTPAAGSD